jgi:Spy/CpxP family protein refolding chaperone
MKRTVLGLLSCFVFLIFVSHYSYAEAPTPPCVAGGRDFPAQGMPMMPPMMPPMMHHGMDMKDGMPGMGPFMGKRLMDLGLDEKQKDAIKDINSKVLKSAIRKRADLEIARIELRDSLDKDIVDLNAVEALLKKTESLMTDIHLLHIKAAEEIKAKLTPEQRKKFKALPVREEAPGKKQQSDEK